MPLQSTCAVIVHVTVRFPYQRGRASDQEPKHRKNIVMSLRVARAKTVPISRPRMALNGKTPAQKAISADSSTNENWLSLIKKASQQQS
jgi:hypothetical protein